MIVDTMSRDTDDKPREPTKKVLSRDTVKTMSRLRTTRPRQDSNLRPLVPETSALSPELRRRGGAR